MAQNVKATVTNIKDAPKRRSSAKAKAAIALEAKRLREDEARGLKGPAVDDDRAEGEAGFGHNGGLDIGTFLHWVQKLNRHEDAGEKLKLALKQWRTDRKLLRKSAGADGVVLGDLDDALDDLKTEQVDLLAREERRRLYHEWLGIPIVAEQALPVRMVGDPKADALYWHNRGNVDGRLGKLRQQPEECPAENIQDYLRGWDVGMDLVLRRSSLTRDGFEPKAPKPIEEEAILVLKEGHFAAGTALEDANLRTLLPAHHEAFDAADRVVAVFGTARRPLKEPDESLPGGIYIDTGEDDAPVSDPEPLDPASLA